MRSLFSVLLLFSSGSVWAHGLSEADKQRMIDGGYFQYIELGARHMLTGYDHLLFLLGVVFFLTSYKDIIKFITAFTLGHSITLIVATLFKITANYYLIDAVIALSVCYKGFDNIDGFKKYLDLKAPDLLKAVFLFGLIHGFGLSTRLQQLPLGNEMGEMLLRIISFNVGVEVGQIVALTVMLFGLASLRKSESFQKFSFIVNCSVIFAGVVLLFMQLHGLSHQISVDELAFSEDGHAHAHQKLKKQESLNMLNVNFDKK